MDDSIAICEICGNPMTYFQEAHICGWMCSVCGDGVATTYIEPILTDTVDYRVILVSDDKSLTSIKMISKIANCNYIEAKKIIEKTPVEVFCGKAVDVKEIKEKLESAGIEIKIEPEFLYQ